MALKKAYNKEFCGNIINFPDTYIQVSKMFANKHHIDMYVTIFSNITKNHVVDEKMYNFVPSVDEGSANFIQQGYEYLKTLPEFADTMDC